MFSSAHASICTSRQVSAVPAGFTVKVKVWWVAGRLCAWVGQVAAGVQPFSNLRLQWCTTIQQQQQQQQRKSRLVTGRDLRQACRCQSRTR
jgi:hypothetical protein